MSPDIGWIGKHQSCYIYTTTSVAFSNVISTFQKTFKQPTYSFLQSFLLKKVLKYAEKIKKLLLKKLAPVKKQLKKSLQTLPHSCLKGQKSKPLWIDSLFV